MADLPNETVRLQIRDGIAHLTLNRPERLNAFTAGMHDALRASLDALEDLGQTLKCVVITGAGRGFCAGQDLAERAAMLEKGDVDLGASINDNYNPLVRRLNELPVPVIAAVNGVAAGAGAAFAVNADITVAARSAAFQFSFVKAGLGPDSGASWNLQRLVGPARALGLALTGERISAEDAERIGLIWKCVEDGALQETADAIAGVIAAGPWNALSATKRRLREAGSLSFDAALDAERDEQRLLGQHPNYREAVSAFLEKRRPKFV